MTPNLWLRLCTEVAGCISLSFGVGDRQSWELRVQGAWTWHHLEKFSSCFFRFWSSCSRVRSTAICSSHRPACCRQSCCLRGCWLVWQQWWSWGDKSSCSLPAEEGEQRNWRRLVLQSWLLILPSSASPGASAGCLLTPQGRLPGGGVRVSSSGYKMSLDA